VTLTSPLGQSTAHRVERLVTGETRLTTVNAAAGQMQTVIGINGTQSGTLPDGTTTNLVIGPDPRWGMQAPLVKTMTATTPGGKMYTTSAQRSATLATPSDLLSLQSLTETVTINGRNYTSAYVAATRTVTSTSPAGRVEKATLDAKGRLIQVQVGNLAPVSYSYDARGRLQTSMQSNRVTRFAYGENGLLSSVTDPVGQSVTFAYDSRGRVTEQLLPGGRIARFAYDPNSNVTAITPPGRTDHNFTYTERDQVSTYTSPALAAESSQTRYTYNAARQPVAIDPPDGRSVGFVYDPAGRLGSIDLLSGDLGFAYDAAGRLNSLNAPAASLSYAYDGGLETSTTWSGSIGGSMTRTYDNNFRIASEGVNSATAIAFQYDDDSLLTGVGNLTLIRNAQNGLLTGTTLGNVTDAIGYNSFGEITNYSAAFNSSNLYNTQYSRDDLGRITRKSEIINGVTNTFDFLYDSAGRVFEVRKNGTLTATYTYDTNGNRLTGPSGTTTYTYDGQDRLLTRSVVSGTSSYAYTASGDLLRKTAGGQTTAYQYDELGNLVKVTMPSGTQIEYVIDGENRRIGKKVNGILVQRYLYADGIKPIAELDANNNVITRYVYSTDVNVPAYMVRSGVIYRLITDELGSVRLAADVSTGVVVQRLDYDEFGNVTGDTTPGFQPFGFAGGLYDPDTKLVRFGARDYDAESGRWTAKDPTGFSSGPNLYIYADNNPVNLVDPFGDAPKAKGGNVPGPAGQSKEGRWQWTERYTNHMDEIVDEKGNISTDEFFDTKPRVEPKVENTLPRGSGTTVSRARIAAGVGSAAVNKFVTAVIISYTVVEVLDSHFCWKDQIVEALTDWPRISALKQFIENREKTGLGTDQMDFFEFANRCSSPANRLTSYCAGFTSY
jgi:RHS repeat-associated protein